MIYVFPAKRRPLALRIALYPLVLAQTYFLHRGCGWRYAAHWANRSVMDA